MTKFPKDNGLWFYEASEHPNVGLLIRKAPCGQVIAEVEQVPGAEDYARLIASAPALLVALQSCLDWGFVDEDLSAIQFNALKKVREALAAAKGRHKP